VKVPEQTPVGKVGNRNYFIKDPNGNKVEIVEYLPTSMTVKMQGRCLPETRIATHMSHAGIAVGRLEESLRFYRDVLGFTETWRGAPGKTLSWLNLRVPDGTDYIEFMLYDQPMTRETLLTKHHVCLEVPDVAKALEILQSRPLPAGCKPPTAVKVGVNGRRQINCFDPDGTRVELMEPNTVDGKSVPSSQAPPPPPLPPYEPESARGKAAEPAK
jgi:lactoylglutathione lyase